MKFRLKLIKLSTVLAALSLVGLPNAAHAASGDTIGEAIEVINLVTADYSRDTRTLQPGDDVRQDEKIAVGSDGRSELQFADQTKIALGPGSELLLDKFVYDSDKNSGSIVMDFVSGTLRFITGVAQKPTYVIRTPNASITVRGTIFDVYTPPKGGPTYLLLHEGGVEVCARKRKKSCRSNSKPGRLTRISKTGKIDNPTVWSVLEGKDGIPFDLAFPFVINPPMIDPSPVFSKGEIINAALERKFKPRKKYKKKAKKKTPKKKKVTKRKTKPKKKYVKRKRKRRTANNNDAAKAAAAAALAIGVGLALRKGRKKGGGGGCRGRGCGGGHNNHYDY